MFGRTITDKRELEEFARGYTKAFSGRNAVSNVPVTADSLAESDKVIAYYCKGKMKAGFVYNRRPNRYLLTLDKETQIGPYQKELFKEGAVETCAMWKTRDFSFFTLRVWVRIFFEIMKTPGKYTIAGIYPSHGMFEYYTRNGAKFLDQGDTNRKLAVFILPKMQFMRSFLFGVRERIGKLVFDKDKLRHKKIN